jgi:predicted RNA-binding Zn-ribbon protein involved in translation (DUF1610 family)
MRVMIHSDGTGPGTVILDEDGNQLDNVIAVNLRMEGTRVNEATVEMQLVQANAASDVTEWIYVCPNCGETEEHKCKGGLNSSQIIAVNPSNGAPLQYTICGLRNLEYMCMVKSDLVHDTHVDTLKGVGWDQRGGITQVTHLAQ